MGYDLTNPEYPVIVFEIDNDTFEGHYRFMRYASQRKALGAILRPVEQGTGHWKGTTSTCYVMAVSDLLNDTLMLELIANQEAVMRVQPGGAAAILGSAYEKMPVVTETVIRVSPAEISSYEGWTLMKSGFFVI